MEKDNNVDVAKYVLWFGLYYLVIVVLVSIVTTLLKIDSNSGSMVPLIIVTMMTSLKFITDNKRVPNAHEKKKLVWFSFVVTWAVSLLLAIVLWSFSGEFDAVIDLVNKTGYGPLFGIILFISTLELLILYFGYGWLANKQYQGLVKKGKI